MLQVFQAELFKDLGDGALVLPAFMLAVALVKHRSERNVCQMIADAGPM